MKTISIQVQDSFMEKFLSFVNSHSKDIVITKDPNLELDPYFYERQKELQKDLEEIKNGKAKMISHEELWSNINKHLETLK